MEGQLNGTTSKMMPIAAEDVKKAYMQRVYAMNHAELFNELMRVHTESARLLQEAIAERDRLQALVDTYDTYSD
jgi:SUMO ligase MMS21 Smc5/6 complex component